MDVTLVARGALDRWALVAGLDLAPGDALDLDAGLARIAHPSTSVEHVLLLVRSAVELTWLRRLRRSVALSGQPFVTAVVAGELDPVHARRAGADAVVTWDGADDIVAVVEESHEGEVVTLVLPDVRAGAS